MNIFKSTSKISTYNSWDSGAAGTSVKMVESQLRLGQKDSQSLLVSRAEHTLAMGLVSKMHCAIAA